MENTSADNPTDRQDRQTDIMTDRIHPGPFLYAGGKCIKSIYERELTNVGIIYEVISQSHVTLFPVV